jgi:hypothetical protein
MKRLISLILAFFLLSPVVVHAQSDTPTPTATETPTPTETPTETPTITPTPDMRVLYELPGDKTGELVYSVTAGDLALIILCAGIFGLLVYSSLKGKRV